MKTSTISIQIHYYDRFEGQCTRVVDARHARNVLDIARAMQDKNASVQAIHVYLYPARGRARLLYGWG